MRTLLIDGDVVAYKAACSVEQSFEWEPGHWTWHADENEAREAVDREIDFIMQKYNGTDCKLCLTDYAHYFRKDILPTYKSTRGKKPLVLLPLRAWMIEERGAYVRPSLEGDDVMGVLATWPKLKGEKVIVSIDKDMKTIPGLSVRHGIEGAKIEEVSEDEADYFHMLQTLTGDATDGYKGCPGMGPKGAEKALAVGPYWPAVVAAFEKAGLTEAEALVQARVARILRAYDYDFKLKKPILWRPPA